MTARDRDMLNVISRTYPTATCCGISAAIHLVWRIIETNPNARYVRISCAVDGVAYLALTRL